MYSKYFLSILGMPHSIPGTKYLHMIKHVRKQKSHRMKTDQGLRKYGKLNSEEEETIWGGAVRVTFTKEGVNWTLKEG